jgi:putative ABC transport system substrate-binding protein
MNPKISLWLLTAILASPQPAEPQQPAKVPRIGYVSPTGDSNNPGPQIEGFRHGLRNLGYIEGKNILVEYRYADAKNERVPSLVAELVQLKVDVLVCANLPAILSARQATKAIPIVMVTTVDPVATEIVNSLSRPGGNITGLTRLTRELSGKRLQLLEEAVPRLSLVAVLWDGGSSGAAIAFKEYETIAQALRVQLRSLEVRGPKPDLEGAFQVAAKWHTAALAIITNPVTRRHSKRIADLAIQNGLPSMCEIGDYVEAGCLMSYSANDAESFKSAALYVDKILKGAKPGDIHRAADEI